MSLSNNPHDHFFRETFSRQDITRDFLTHYLPTEIREHLDLGVLQTVKDTFVDEDLRDHFTDLLYRTRLRDESVSGEKDEAYVYLLFEHKSYPEPWVAFQLLRYIVRIWEHRLNQHTSGKPVCLPPIIPMVLYHGKTGWHVDTRLHGLVDAPDALLPYIPDFRYAVYDFSVESQIQIMGSLQLQIVLRMLRHVMDESAWPSQLGEMMALLHALAQAQDGLSYLEIVLRYLVAAAPNLEPEDLHKALTDTFPDTGGALMSTIAEAWIEQGVEKGKKQGIEQGVEQGVERGVVQATREAILETLEVRFGSCPAAIEEQIADLTGQARLKLLHRQALLADSLTDFANHLKLDP
ncbi:MAG: Rpn family recombination-promoting nuclease/putative transposase [Chloroflexi bacterium]|nr:Rpn family recombination-promoting nuclease/putative transposase [Chloroflexota bacterium]